MPRGAAARSTCAVNFTRGFAWKAILASVALSVSLDWLTGQNIWFGPIYLLIIAFSAWSLGWRVAVGMGLACLVLNLIVSDLKFYPYDHPASILDLITRFLMVVTTIGLIRLVRQAYEREWDRARTDPLTRALNRQAFFEAMAELRSSSSWTLLAYADLDGLKRLNDRDGHLAGDDCLKVFAQHVKASIRSGDIFARIGGDEFLVHMFVKDEAAAKMVADRLHSVMNGPWAVRAGVRCSLGVLFLPPGARSIEREIQITDELMYEAKGHGGALVAATGHDRRGTLFISRHWDILHLPADVGAGVPSAGGAGTVAPIGRAIAGR